MGLLYREPATNVVAKELITRNIANGNHIKYDFKENSTCIIYIEYDAERTFLKTTTTVEELKNKSTFVSKRAPGSIYKYVNVWVGDKGGGLPTSLKNGSIGFRIEKVWINNSTANINDSFVTLQLYNKSNTSWEPLYTEKTGEDNNYMYFKSTTPGFSSFAITTYTGVLDKNGTQVGAKLQDTLTGLEGAGKVGLNGSANKSKAQEARSAAKMLMAISLPLFLLFVGYLVVKKKI
jgi:PGF-pre-PGF domain-containing protein